MKKILHITTHMGGGIGRTISDLVTTERNNEHRIVMLQFPEKDVFVNKCTIAGIMVKCVDFNNENRTFRELEDFLEWCDVVVIHWWHHPIMCKVLCKFPKVPVRVILWSHVSGCSYPYLTPELIDESDWLFVTSECSWENYFWSRKERADIRAKSTKMYGLGKLNQMKEKKKYKLNDTELRIGYIGTFTRSKMHPQFTKMCYEIIKQIPNVKFYLIGDKESGKWIQYEAQEFGIEKYISFEGYVNNVNDYLLSFDIFGYPLNPYHFGTTENSVLEAMSVGLPVVLMNQSAERYIVENHVDGILAKDEQDYVKYIVLLAHDEKVRKRLGQAAKQKIAQAYDYNKHICKFQEKVEFVVCNFEKRTRNFQKILGDTPWQWMLSGTNPKDKILLNEGRLTELPFIFHENSKSSLKHFQRIFGSSFVIGE